MPSESLVDISAIPEVSQYITQNQETSQTICHYVARIELYFHLQRSITQRHNLSCAIHHPNLLILQPFLCIFWQSSNQSITYQTEKVH